MSTRGRVIVGVSGLVVLALAAAAFFVLRPGATATSAQGVTLECSAATGLTAQQCLGWGEEALANPEVATFEIEDVVRVTLDRPMFGLSSSCRVEYFLGRYPDEPALSRQTACPMSSN